jgi:outer membrane lipoprotein LolB
MLAVVSGCATHPAADRVVDDAALDARHTRLAGLTRWDLAGRLAISNKTDSWQASVNWRQVHDRYSVQVRGPLGQGAAMLQGDSHAVVLRTSEGQERHDGNPEALLFQQFGWRVPVSALRHWVKGIPAPGPFSVSEQGPDGQPGELQQDGWRIRYKQYVDVGDWTLPGKVYLYQDDWVVKLVIDQWNL